MWLLILILVAIIAVVAVYLLRGRTISFYSHCSVPIKKMFNNTSTTYPVGGFLVSMFTNDDARKKLEMNSFEYSTFDQCASINRHTCAAFTLFRRDVWCCPFITAGMDTGIGVILDVNKMWPLLTGSFVIDADTDSRSLCSNENGSSYSRCGKDVEMTDAGSSYPYKCAPDDAKCMSLNSGGSINSNALKCDDCGTFQNCAACNKPYLCSGDAPRAGAANPYTDDEAVTAYLGKDAREWNKLFISEDLNTGFTSTSQCRFSKNDLGLWLKALHGFYTLILTRGITLVPAAPAYLENEMNSYIYPDNSSPVYRAQQKIFLDSILGFFYISDTCERQIQDASSNPEEDCNTMFGQNVTGARREIEMCNRRGYQVNSGALAKLVSQQTGRTIPVYGAVLDSNNFTNPVSIQKALRGEVNFNDMFARVG